MEASKIHSSGSAATAIKLSEPSANQYLSSFFYRVLSSTHIHFISRVLLGTLFMEISHHLIYPYTIVEIDNLSWEIPLLSLGGVIYLISQHFTVKYTVLWSYTSLFACMDRLTTPALPKCTSCFYYVSDIWRCFDSGLYEFIKRSSK